MLFFGMEKKLTDHINELKVIRHHINPLELEVGEEYHIPPFFSIERMDILITSKNDGVVKFKVTNNPSKKDEMAMEQSSILSRFVVKKMKF